MIEYKGTPLFGEGSSVSHTSEFFAIAGTILFWLLFLIFSFVIKAQPKKPEYKEVQIVLSSTPVVQKTEEAPAPAEAASASAASESTASAESPASAETPVMEVAKVQPVVETSPAPKAEPASKAEPAPVKETPKLKAAKPKEVPVTYAVDPMEAFENQTKQQSKQPVYWDAKFNDAEPSETSFAVQTKTVTAQSSMSGTGGTAASTDQAGIKSESQQRDNNQEITHGSDIGKVRDTQEIGTSENPVGKNPNKSNGKDNNSVIWTEGTGARTYYKLDTELSQKAKSSMQVSKDTPFTITFSVDSDGNVMATTIEIKNEFILSEIIKNEMKEKISKWKFGKGSGISKAKFDWILSPGN